MFMLSDFWAQTNNTHFDKGFESGMQERPQTYHNRRTEIIRVLNAAKDTNPMICTR